ncbi:septum formation inhibitor Maf [Salicibibacter cibarius]|uniref:dTTP/UTP pyrophosphatase n=1 Tax=Salicibibacter cibarius TaxID=2743000 RepID=A0A7T7CCN2_9BACI|nr:Maf family protein [Salicibibacter cibarius]QQK77118.1 septum formation inhibitor Maf [Salicibibacter cibarius]
MLILASASSRRQQLLNESGYAYTVAISNIEEKINDEQTPADNAVQLATAKAADVYNRYPDAVILAADTIVAIDGGLLGKPMDESDAVRMLTHLSGKKHEVYTGVCIKQGTKTRAWTEKTNVYFHHLSEQCIQAYVETGEPMDKAGAYGIQGKGARLVERFAGDYYNVVGLPIAKVVRVLRDFQIYPGGERS